MPLHKDFIKKAAKKAIREHVSADLISAEELEQIITAAIYDVLNSRDFEAYIKEIAK